MSNVERANPYAPMSASGDGPKQPSAPRWLAVLLSALTLPLAGTGMFLLRRSRRNWIWIALSAMVLASYAVAGAIAPRLILPVMLAMVLLWAAGIVAAFSVGAGRFMGWPRTLLVVVSVVILNQAVARTTRFAAVEAFSIPNGSMNPTLVAGDHIVVSKFRRVPRRGDVFVFKYPLDPSTDYIKRVIGLPGDVLAVKHDQVSINGAPLLRRLVDEPCQGEDGGSCELWEEQAGERTYRVMQQMDRPYRDLDPVKIPADHYFVLGDNRNNSSDSRVWGTVPAEMMKGRAVSIYWSSGSGGLRWSRVGKPIE